MRLKQPVEYRGKLIRYIEWCNPNAGPETLTWLHETSEIGPDFDPAWAYAPLTRSDLMTHYWSIPTLHPRAKFAERVKELVDVKPVAFREVSGNFIGGGVLLPPTLKMGQGNVIYPGVALGSDVEIGSNCTIGGPGFNFYRDDYGKPYRMIHFGGVTIGQGAVIHNNVNIDAGILEPTIIGAHVIIDSLVHVAHDCVIGEGTTITAGATLAGWVRLGRRVWIAPNTTIKNRVYMDHGSKTGMQANVVKNVGPDTTVIGNPARPYYPKRETMDILAEANGV